MEHDNTVSIHKYILRFAIINLIATLVITAILIFFNLDNNSLHMVVLMFSAMIVGETFVKDNKRPPETSEKLKLIGFSFLVAWLISFVTLCVVSLVHPEILPALKQLFSSTSLTFLLGILLITIILMLLMLWLGYGFLTTKRYKTLERKGEL